MSDYRRSHLAKGADYDEALATSPFDAYMHQHEQQVLRRILATRFPDGIDRYIDFACGTGRITAVVEPFAREPYGIDVSETMIGEAQRKCPRTSFVLADITRSQVAIPPAHLVTAFRFLGNAQPELGLAALRALAPLVRPDGYLVVNNHRNPLSMHNLLLRALGTPCLELTYGHLSSMLRAAGFEIVESHAIGLWVVANRLHRRAVLRGEDGSRVERLSAFPGAARFAPDAIIVARRAA